MKVLFAASECVPFVKTGGLADVIGALPGTLLKLLRKSENAGKKSEVAVILPKYSLIDEKEFNLKKIPGKILIPVGDRLEEGEVWSPDSPDDSPARGRRRGDRVRVYFIGNEKYFRRPALYRTREKDFDDNDERFIFFSRAVLECCKFIDFVPDIVHGHDWQTGLVPAYLKTHYRTDAFFRRTASVFTIHNIAYQGIFPKQTLFSTGFSWHDFTPDKLEYFDQISFLKAGLVYAGKISTVSPTYCREVQENAERGSGMEGVLKSRSKDFSGIINGLDYGQWNPEKDFNLAARFSMKSGDLPEKKKTCKKDLQERAGLKVDESVPLAGIVSRLDPQKGFWRVIEILPKLIDEGVPLQWVILGLGDQSIQERLSALAKHYPGQVSFNAGFDDPLAHKIYGGSDIFFMPSQFEPCGLSQMIAMKYGSVPVVTPTGGLLDTVSAWDNKNMTGTGFLSPEISSDSLLQTLKNALEIFPDKEQWKKLMTNAMRKDFSWPVSAKEYLKLYRSAAPDLRT